MPVACGAGMVIAGREDTLCPALRSSPLPGECPCAVLAELPWRPFSRLLALGGPTVTVNGLDTHCAYRYPRKTMEMKTVDF